MSDAPDKSWTCSKRCISELGCRDACHSVTLVTFIVTGMKEKPEITQLLESASACEKLLICMGHTLDYFLNVDQITDSEVIERLFKVYPYAHGNVKVTRLKKGEYRIESSDEVSAARKASGEQKVAVLTDIVISRKKA